MKKAIPILLIISATLFIVKPSNKPVNNIERVDEPPVAEKVEVVEDTKPTVVEVAPEAVVEAPAPPPQPTPAPEPEPTPEPVKEPENADKLRKNLQVQFSAADAECIVQTAMKHTTDDMFWFEGTRLAGNILTYSAYHNIAPDACTLVDTVGRNTGLIR